MNEEKDIRFINLRQVKNYIAAQGFNSSGDIWDPLQKEIADILDKACNRAKLNNRKTVLDKDV